MVAKLLHTTHGADNRPVIVAKGISLVCYVLEGGIAVVTDSSLQKAIELDSVIRFVNDPMTSNLFSEGELKKLNHPIAFVRPSREGSKEALGYAPELVIDFCNRLLQFTSIYNREALECIAKVDLLQLIHKTTGYKGDVGSAATEQPSVDFNSLLKGVLSVPPPQKNKS